MNDKQVRGLQQFCNQYFADDVAYSKKKEPQLVYVPKDDMRKASEHYKGKNVAIKDIEEYVEKNEKSRKMLEQAGFEW